MMVSVPFSRNAEAVRGFIQWSVIRQIASKSVIAVFRPSTSHEPRMLSIVIPTHHRTDLLQACLQAVTRHAPAGSEIIVVDDASPDGAASEVAATFGVRILRLKR